MGTQFDDLSKALASGQSRRKALLGFAGATGAALVATILPGKSAEADSSVEKRCKDWCRAVYGRGTEAAKECVKDARSQSGDCYRCGPAASADDQERSCGSYYEPLSAVCCPDGQICLHVNGSLATCYSRSIVLNGTQVNGCDVDCTELSEIKVNGILVNGSLVYGNYLCVNGTSVGTSGLYTCEGL